MIFQVMISTIFEPINGGSHYDEGTFGLRIDISSSINFQNNEYTLFRNG